MLGEINFINFFFPYIGNSVSELSTSRKDESNIYKTDTLQEALEIIRLHETENVLRFCTNVTTKDFG